MEDHPIDPFSGDPADPTAALGDDDVEEPLAPDEREEVLADLEDLEIFRTLLADRGIRGLVVDCDDCEEAHYFGWELLRSNLRHLLDVGQTRVHEPAFSPDPTHYVSWDYAHGFADGVMHGAEAEEPAVDPPPREGPPPGGPPPTGLPPTA